MSKHRFWEHWFLCPLLHCNGARPRLISCLYVPILIKLKWLSESMQEEMLLQQLPPMADLAKIFLHRDFFPQWDLSPLKQFFKSTTACSFHHAMNINFLMKITVGSRRGERWVLQHLPVGCLDYSYNCSLNLPSVPSCAYIWDSFPVVDGFAFFLKLPGSRLPCPPRLPGGLFYSHGIRPFRRLLSLFDY